MLLLALATSAQDPCAESGVKCDHTTGGQLPAAFPRAARWRARSRNGHEMRTKQCPAETDMTRLEDLWPEKHFRGPLRGPQSYFRRVPPHFLGHHANFTRCRRRVYIDVGARTFEAGLLPMLKTYPALGHFDEFYLFEAVPGFYKLPPVPKLERLLAPYMTPDEVASFPRRHFFFQAFIAARSEPSTIPPTIGFSDMLQNMLRLQPNDAVVVKLDVEGFEFEIATSLLADGTHALIDELMLEVHYGHPDMRAMFNWCKKPLFWCRYTLNNATNMYQTLRDAGVYTHHWP